MTLRACLPDIKSSLGQAHGRRGITLLLVLLSLASALVWFMAARRMGALPAAATVAAAPPVPAGVPLLGEAELARLLGAAGAPVSGPAPGARFVLVGVIAGASGQGAALIAVDGQPAQPFRVGMEVAPGFVLQRLAAREVMLAETPEGPVKLTLPLPAWQPAPPSPRPTPVPGAELPAPANPGAPSRQADPSGP